MVLKSQTLTCLSVLLGVTSAIALPAVLRERTTSDEACKSENFAQRHFIGGESGDEWCAVPFKKTGDVVTQVSVWSDDDGIRGIQFSFSGGSSPSMQGEQGQGSAQNLNLKAGELISTARLWGNGKAQHLGHIYLKTSHGQEFDVGMKKPNDGYDIDVGGGLLLGGTGHTDDNFINEMALIFLRSKIEGATISEINFDSDQDPTGSSKNIRPVYLFDSSFGNPADSDNEVPFTVSASQTVKSETHWEQSATTSFGMSGSVNVEAKIFGIGASATAGYEWTAEDGSTEGGSQSEEFNLASSIGPIVLKPGQGKRCKIVAQKGEGDFSYTSTVTLHLEGGGEAKYQEAGKLKTVQYVDAKGSCDDADQPIKWDATTDNPPKGVKVGKAVGKVHLAQKMNSTTENPLQGTNATVQNPPKALNTTII